MPIDETINDLKDIIYKRILTEEECDVLWSAIEYLNAYDTEYDVEDEWDSTEESDDS